MIFIIYKVYFNIFPSTAVNPAPISDHSRLFHSISDLLKPLNKLNLIHDFCKIFPTTGNPDTCLSSIYSVETVYHQNNCPWRQFTWTKDNTFMYVKLNHGPIIQGMGGANSRAKGSTEGPSRLYGRLGKQLFVPRISEWLIQPDHQEIPVKCTPYHDKIYFLLNCIVFYVVSPLNRYFYKYF